MKNFLLLWLCLGVIGCTTKVVPLSRTFPDAPPSLQQPCPELILIPEDTHKLSDVLLVVTSNYRNYHECRFKVESWNTWYNQQKQIFESVK